jgi:hypothetical protein
LQNEEDFGVYIPLKYLSLLDFENVDEKAILNNIKGEKVFTLTFNKNEMDSHEIVYYIGYFMLGFFTLLIIGSYIHQMLLSNQRSEIYKSSDTL